MSEAAIVDTGPLVAYVHTGDEHHAWAVETFRVIRVPMVTCEPVLAESLYLLRASPRAQDAILDWVARGTLVVEFDLAEEVAAVRRLMKKYRDVPMSLADACLVAMTESRGEHAVCTLDTDFHVYRRSGGKTIRLLTPAAR